MLEGHRRTHGKKALDPYAASGRRFGLTPSYHKAHIEAGGIYICGRAIECIGTVSCVNMDQ